MTLITAQITFKNGTHEDVNLTPLHLETPLNELAEYFTNVYSGVDMVTITINEPFKRSGGETQQYFRMIRYADGYMRIENLKTKDTVAVFVNGAWLHIVDNFYDLTDDAGVELLRLCSIKPKTELK